MAAYYTDKDYKMKKFFIAVISLVILAIVGYGIAYVVTPVTSVELEEYTHEVKISCDQAYIVRDETVYYATAAGTVYNSSSEGSRVSRDTVISSIYPGTVDSAALRELRTIDTKISRLKKRESESKLYSSDSTSVESAVADRIGSIPDLASDNNIEQIHEYKEDINSLRAGGDISLQTKITDLQNEKSIIETSLGGRTDILSDRAGIFSSYIDGLESVLTPDRIPEYNATYIRSLSTQYSRRSDESQIIIGDPVCKIMNNHKWYVLGITNADYIGLCEIDKSVTVRFTNLSGSKAEGTITYVSEPDQNGEYIFLVEIPSYLESAFSYRNIDADIIFEEYSGYKIPTDAVRTGDTLDSYYVYATQGSDTYKCDCNVLYTDIAEGYSIIQSTENAENKLAVMERLIVGER